MKTPLWLVGVRRMIQLPDNDNPDDDYMEFYVADTDYERAASKALNLATEAAHQPGMPKAVFELDRLIRNGFVDVPEYK